jgi:hypothetical protein
MWQRRQKSGDRVSLISPMRRWRTYLDLQQLRVELQRLSIAMWVVWAFVTWIGGVGLLVMSNYGFGVGLDYIKCFLWGLGVQVAGQQFQQLAPSSVTTAFNVSVPK